MPRINPIDPATAPAGTKATLDAVKAKIGMVPNLHSTLAHAPAALNGYLALGDALVSGLLTPRQREIVALATGQAKVSILPVGPHASRQGRRPFARCGP